MNIESLSAFYRRVIDGKQPLNPLFQVGMVRHLIAGEEFDLLAKFAARPDVSPEADALVKECANPRVIAGWASRPGCDITQVLERLSSEKRVTALLPLTSVSNLPEEIYGMLLARQSPKLAKALLANTTLSREVKEKFLPEFVAALEHRERGVYDYQRIANFAAFTGEDVDLLVKSLAFANDPVLIVAGLERLEEEAPARLAEAVALVVSRIGDIAGAKKDEVESSAAARASGLPELFENLGAKELDPGQLKDVRAALRTVSERFQQYRCADLLRTAKFALSQKGRGVLAEVLELGSTTDTARAGKLVKQLVTGRCASDSPYYMKARRALVDNAALPVELVLPLVAYLGEGDRCTLVSRWLEQGDFEAVAKLLYEEYDVSEYIGHVEDVTPIIEAVIRLAADEDDVIPGWVLEHEMLATNPELAISLLPWKTLSDIEDPEYTDGFDDDPPAPRENPDGTSGAEQVTQTAQDLIAASLGSDPQRWETFASLAEEFEGTLPDLLHAAASL